MLFSRLVLPGLSSLGQTSTQFQMSTPCQIPSPRPHHNTCPSTVVTWVSCHPCRPVSTFRMRSVEPFPHLRPSSYHDAWCRVVLDTGLHTTTQNSFCALRQVMASVFLQWKIKESLRLHDLWGHLPVLRISEKCVVYRLAFHGSCAGVMIYNNNDGNGKNREHLLSP